MKRILLPVHHFVTNPFTAAGTGMLVIGAALYEILHSQRDSMMGEVGLLLFGFMVAVRALPEILESLDTIDKAVKKNDSSLTTLRRLVCWVETPHFEFSTAFLILCAGSLEAWKTWHSHERNQMWHVGVTAFGLSLAIKSISNILEATSFAEKAGEQIRTSLRLFHRLAAAFRKPLVEVSIGSLLILLVVWEEWSKVMAEEPLILESYYTIALLGILRVGEFLPDLLKGLEFISDGE
jgi:hypothetical protein